MRWTNWRIGVMAAAVAVLAPWGTHAAEKASPADTIAEKFANADKPPGAVPAAVVTPDRPTLDYEMDMLRRARAESEARKPQALTAEPAKLEAAKPAVVKPAAATVEPPKIETAKPEAVKPVEAAKAGTTSPAETVEPTSPSPAPALPNPAVATAPGATAADPLLPRAPTASPVAAATSVRATILLVLERRDATSPPDPIVCFGETCAISAGLTTPARTLPRSEALALKSTQDATTDPCFGKSACAFRDVPLPPDAILQVISAGSGANPAQSAGYSVAPDATCKVVDGDIDCGQPLATSDFTAWVVPEDTAKSAGAPALEMAIVDGLPTSELTQKADK